MYRVDSIYSSLVMNVFHSLLYNAVTIFSGFHQERLKSFFQISPEFQRLIFLPFFPPFYLFLFTFRQRNAYPWDILYASNSRMSNFFAGWA